MKKQKQKPLKEFFSSVSDLYRYQIEDHREMFSSDALLPPRFRSKRFRSISSAISNMRKRLL